MGVAVTQVQRSSGPREKDPLETLGQVASLAKTGYDMTKGGSSTTKPTEPTAPSQPQGSGFSADENTMGNDSFQRRMGFLKSKKEY